MSTDGSELIPANGRVESLRTPQAIIDQAIQENRGAAILCYVLVVVFVVAGLFALIWGAWHGEGAVALAGSLTGGLFWPALNQARLIREKNMAIRLLELTVTGARDARQTAIMLRDVYRDLFSREKKS